MSRISDTRRASRTRRSGRAGQRRSRITHAFLFWPRDGLVVVPFDQRAVGYRVGRAHGIELVGRIAHPTGTVSPTITRSVVVGDSVFTLSDGGVASSGLANLA